jgi:hypothetical protein
MYLYSLQIKGDSNKKKYAFATSHSATHMHINLHIHSLEIEQQKDQLERNSNWSTDRARHNCLPAIWCCIGSILLPSTAVSQPLGRDLLPDIIVQIKEFTVPRSHRV